MSASTLTVMRPFPFFLSILLFIAQTKTPARCTEDCPWLTPTNNASMGCNDGSTCDTPSAWTCCSGRGGRAKCPLDLPLMCAKPNACAGSSDYCCESDCGEYGGIRQCGELISGDNAYLILSSKAKFDYTFSCF